jgi:hypothetical protein
MLKHSVYATRYRCVVEGLYTYFQPLYALKLQYSEKIK